MANVCVITGGGSGIGLEAAKYISKEKIILLAGRNPYKLENAMYQLRSLDYTAYAKLCDVSNRASVSELAQVACGLGNVKNIIHCAGVSPAMGYAQEDILRINALGTVYVNQEFSKVMLPGGVIVNVASAAAYSLPDAFLSTKAYALAETGETAFLAQVTKKLVKQKDEGKKKSLAYAISKHFVIWYAKKCAFAYGSKGIRVVSISPGITATDMGNMEKQEWGKSLPMTTENCAGSPQEVGFAVAMLADERNGYLAGVDVLCDGGATTRAQEFKK